MPLGVFSNHTERLQLLQCSSTMLSQALAGRDMFRPHLPRTARRNHDDIYSGVVARHRCVSALSTPSTLDTPCFLPPPQIPLVAAGTHQVSR